jgi:serine/threonine-protein kinase
MTQPPLQLDLSPSDAQLGKYRLVATLGQGGMGTVYLALASGLGAFRKLLVVKELRRDLPWKESSLEMFMDEAHLAARLDHPNVLQTFEAGEDNGRYFLAMEYLDGQPLSALLDRARANDDMHCLPLELRVHILSEVLNGLQYAHELRDYDGSLLHVVHRDISPQNIFVTYHGQVKVVDFGVAKASTASNLTSPGVFKGKFAYAAPEQLLGRPVDGRCDVFAVGVMLWEAIAGRRFGDSNPTPTSFRNRTQGREPRIAQVVPDVDPLLAEISDRALAVDPEQRFVSAAAFRYRLQEYLALQGEHIESAQVASVMRSLFARERKAVHHVIERAMADVGATRSVIQALPMVIDSAREREVTARADLSRLVAVSHEVDDEKIHRAYEQSKVSRLDKPRFEPPPWASAALLVGLAVSVFLATFHLSRDADEPELPARPAPKVLTHTLPPAPQPLAAEPDSAPAHTARVDDKIINRRRSGDDPSSWRRWSRRRAEERASEPNGAPTEEALSADAPNGDQPAGPAEQTPQDAPASDLGGVPSSTPSEVAKAAPEPSVKAEPAPAKAESPSAEPAPAKAEPAPSEAPAAPSETPSAAAPAAVSGNARARRTGASASDVAPKAVSPRPAAAQPSMGANLREMRRPANNLRIDVEDPYQ